MPNIIMTVLFMLAGAIAMLVVAAVHFGAVFLAMDAIDGAPVDSGARAFGYRLSHLVSIAGICVGLGLGVTVAQERLRRPDGKPDYPSLIVGWALAIPVFALFLYAGFGEAFDLVVDHKALGIMSVVLYGSFVAWIANKLAKPATR